MALSLIGTGRALVKRGSVADGMALLDAAMLDALSGRLRPVWTGAEPGTLPSSGPPPPSAPLLHRAREQWDWFTVPGQAAVRGERS